MMAMAFRVTRRSGEPAPRPVIRVEETVSRRNAHEDHKLYGSGGSNDAFRCGAGSEGPDSRLDRPAARPMRFARNWRRV